MCLDGGCRLCSIRLTLVDFRPGDSAVLRPCRGCGCLSRTFLCQGEALFGFLSPGDYALTLYRGQRHLTLLVRLSPGSNAEFLCRLNTGCCRWQRDGWHYFFNRR